MPTSFYTLVLFAWLLALLRRTTCAIPLSPSLDENPKYEQAIGRSLPENVNNTLDVPSNTTIPPMLKKRMCNPGPSNQVICNIMVPGVDDANAQIEAKGVVGRLPSVFYTAYPLQLAAARQWASCFFQEEQPAQSADYTFGIWGRIANNAWVAEVSISLSDAMLEADFTDDQIKPFSDMFLKNLSQGYAEKAQGDVYLVVKDSVAPDNVSWDVNAAWGGKQCNVIAGQISAD